MIEWRDVEKEKWIYENWNYSGYQNYDRLSISTRFKESVELLFVSFTRVSHW